MLQHPYVFFSKKKSDLKLSLLNLALHAKNCHIAIHAQPLPVHQATPEIFIFQLFSTKLFTKLNFNTCNY